MDVIEYWVLSKDYGQEGLGEPLGLFTTETAAKDWAFESSREKNKQYFISSFYLGYSLEKVKVIK